MSVLIVISTLLSCNKNEGSRKSDAKLPPNPSDTLEGVTTSFVPNAILTKGELQDLVQLANQCGIERVSQIRTYYIHPTSNCGIQIKGTEVISGRKVSFVTISLRYKDPYDDERIGNVVATVGDFKVREHRIYNNLLTTFPTREGTTRVRLADDVPLVTADRIIELFAKGQVRYKDESLSKKLQSIDLSKPQSLHYNKDEGTIIITFAIGEYGTAALEFTFEADEVMVSKVQKIMS